MECLFGASFARVGSHYSCSIVAIGMGIQNFPEGIAVLFHWEEWGKQKKVTLDRQLIGDCRDLLCGSDRRICSISYSADLTFCYVCFTAGAMIYIVVEEVIPETQRDKYTDIAVMAFAGFNHDDIRYSTGLIYPFSVWNFVVESIYLFEYKMKI